MVNVDINRKYRNLMASKVQFFVDQKDITLNYGIVPASLTVEDRVSAQFTVDNASAWINSALFKVGMALEIAMGYADMVEPVFVGEISAVKTIFSSSCPPQIMVFGKEKPVKEPVAASAVVSLTYGATLHSFTSTTDDATQSCIFCVGECVGLPDIKIGDIVDISGLSSQFNRRYIVKKAIHTFDGAQGLRTQFEAKSFDLTKRADVGSRSILRKRA